jgi:REP element-mobilizing transposase RayT
MADHCRLCSDLNFNETTLCELNRSVQQAESEFKCQAFRPRMSLITAAGEITPGKSVRHRDGSVLARQLKRLKLLHDDKIKYRRALAQQHLARDPEAVIIELKFHYAWNVSDRRPLFAGGTNTVACLSDILLTASLPSVLHTGLLWLAPDHIHVYCEADGQDSPENIVRGLKHLSEQALLAQFTDIAEALGANGRIWDEGYFVETLG